jgi:1,4-dihydroxy-2-naphthoyl-CoA hydrolase
MTMWARKFSLEELDAIGAQSASGHYGIRYTAIDEHSLEATLPLSADTKGVDGTLHPGALSILAETIGSVGANLCIDTQRFVCVGQVLNVNHTAPITVGAVRAKATALTIRPESQIWDVEMKDSSDVVVGVARLTMAVLTRP